MTTNRCLLNTNFYEYTDLRIEELHLYTVTVFYKQFMLFAGCGHAAADEIFYAKSAEFSR